MGETSPVATDFLAKFYSARRQCLPIQSNFYSELQREHKTERRLFHSKWGGYFKTRLPISTRRYYNECFEEVAAAIGSLLLELNLPHRVNQRTRVVYGFRLRSRATLGDLLAADVFWDKTQSQDIPLPDVIEGLTAQQIRDHVYKTRACHMFLHRAQRTEFLFLHELIVGYLGNIILKGGRIPKRKPVISSIALDYWGTVANTAIRASQVLKCTPAELASLHFLESKDVKSILPVRFQNLFLVSSHIFWYLEQLNAVHSLGTTSEMLNILLLFFVNPSLERMWGDPKVQLARRAGVITDRRLCKMLLASVTDTSRKEIIDNVVAAMTEFAGCLWQE